MSEINNWDSEKKKRYDAAMAEIQSMIVTDQDRVVGINSNNAGLDVFKFREKLLREDEGYTENKSLSK